MVLQSEVLLLILVPFLSQSLRTIHLDAFKGKFDWKRSGKFPGITSPSEGYHGLVFSETFGSVAYIVKVRTEASLYVPSFLLIID
jgi:hypothetical protein